MSCTSRVAMVQRRTSWPRSTPRRTSIGSRARGEQYTPYMRVSSPRHGRPLLQEIPHLGQQGLLLRQWRRVRRFFVLGFHEPSQKLDDTEEDGGRDKEKVDH